MKGEKGKRVQAGLRFVALVAVAVFWANKVRGCDSEGDSTQRR
jgi:hypothetical protein